MVELEDPIDGIDEVPGPPQAEAGESAASPRDADPVSDMAPDLVSGIAPEAPPSPVSSAV